MIVHYSESPSDEYIAINLQADIDYIDYLQQKWDQGTYLSSNPVREAPTRCQPSEQDITILGNFTTDWSQKFIFSQGAPKSIAEFNFAFNFSPGVKISLIWIKDTIYILVSAVYSFP